MLLFCMTTVNILHRVCASCTSINHATLADSGLFASSVIVVISWNCQAALFVEITNEQQLLRNPAARVSLARSPIQPHTQRVAY